jgi:type IV fimbrial biogenesis protein FimT
MSRVPNSSIGRSAGVSLVELMVTIFIVAILVAIAVPSFRSTFQRSDVVSASNALSADIQYARGQASNQHRFISLCRSASGTACDSANDYDQGWIVYSYDVGAAGPDQAYKAGSNNMQLLRTTPLLKGVSMLSQDKKVITFKQTGEFVTSSGRTGTSFVVCSRESGVTTGLGTNTQRSQGSLLVVRASGSITVTPLPLTSSCLL